jgi:S1-C subfamily serine protease
LVTVIHRIPVRDLLESLRRQGIQASALDGLTRSQQITNITTGLVVDERGRILVRLISTIADPREADVTVLTRDGRTVRPTFIRCDEATGYAVLEVPGLGIAPPTFVREGALWPSEAQVKVLAHAPEMMRAGEVPGLPIPPPKRTAPAQTEPGASPSWRHLLPMRFKLEAARLKLEGALVADPRSRPDAHPMEAMVTRPMLRLELPTAEWSADGGVILTEKGEVLGVAEEQAPGAYVVRSTESLRALTAQLLARVQESAAAGQEVARKAAAAAQQAALEAQRAAQALGRPARGWIGVRAMNISTLGDTERAALSTVPEAAVVVTEVLADGPAKRAGVEPGDVLLRYRDQAVTSVEALANLIAQTPVGLSVPVTIWRRGEVRQLLIPIEERPSAPAAESPPSPPPTVRADVETTAQWTPARLGVRVMDLTDQLADFFGVREGKGVLIVEVTSNGPAADAGARAGDVIVGLGAAPIRNRSDLLRALRSLTSETVPLRIIREREPLVLTLRLR